jgi:CD109 antigen
VAFNPTGLGLIPIKITAKGSLSGDKIEKTLRVVPEGIARSITNSTMIVLESSSTPRQKRDVSVPTTNTINSILTITLPPGAYEDTVKASAIVVGDIIGKTMNNLENLISFPSGCGEQNLIKLVPNIVIWKYLFSTCELSEIQKKKLYHFSIAGYQNQLNFQRKDGSFSAFGNNDVNGSTWLTSYTVLSLYWAKNFIPIDLKVINRGMNFINSTQQSDGSFKENGRIIHSDMQGGLGTSIALTAYISIVLSNVLPSYCNYTTTRDKANQYLVNNLHLATNIFEKGIVAYALELANISDAYNSFFWDRTETSSMIYWKNKEPEVNTFWTKSAPRSVDIEITAYGLLLMLKRNDIQTAAKIAKYLISKSNSFGGYSSTQDTVMALLALSKFSARIAVNNPSINLELTTSSDPALIHVKIDTLNVATMQQFEVSSIARNLKFKARPESRGIAIVTFAITFYEDPAKVVPSFEISYNFTEFCSNKIIFDSCARYIPDGVSNMAIMEVTLPSGFYYQNNGFKDLNPEVSKVEVSEQGSKIIFYFNSISGKNSCVSIQAYRARFVIDVKGSTIVVHDYYDTCEFCKTIKKN